MPSRQPPEIESSTAVADQKAGRGTAQETAQWSVYILRCADNSLYTGVTTDVGRRLDEHNGLAKNGAKYTRNRLPVMLVYQEIAASRSEACKREAAIKNLKKPQKEKLIVKSQKNSDKKHFLDPGQVIKKHQ